MGLTPAQSYEDALGDGLEAVLKEGNLSLEQVVEGLNARNIHGPNGERWTAALLRSELERLAP